MRSPLDLPATPQRVRALGAARLLSADGLEAALTAIGQRPTTTTWVRNARLFLLVVGVGLLAAGAVFFIAANWQQLGPFFRMGLVVVAMAASLLVGLRAGPDTVGGRASLTLSGLLVGPLFALFGQTYQTGADAYGLFVLWALLNLPFVVAARNPVAVVLELIIINTACTLYVEQMMGSRSEFLLGGALMAINGAALVITEALNSRQARFLDGRLAPRVIALLLGMTSIGSATLSLERLFRGSHEPIYWVLIIGVIGIVAAMLAVYRRRQPDLAMLAIACTVGMTVASTAMGFTLFEVGMELSAVFFLGFFILAEVYVVARLLLGWRREMGGAS